MRVAGLKFPPLERLGDLLDPEKSPLNPKFFAYGSFPFYLLKFVSWLTGGPRVFDIRLLGRALSAIFDAITIIAVFFLGKRLYGQKVGILASAFLALAVTHIQNSHYFAVDIMLTSFITLAMVFAARVADQGGRKNAVAMGLLTGLALATKVSAAPLLLTVIVAGQLRWIFDPKRKKSGWKEGFQAAGLALITAALTFAIAQPYALLDWHRFIANVQEQSGMARGIIDFPYTRQYAGTPAYLYQIHNHIVWGLGPPLGILAWSGFLFAIITGIIRRRKNDLLLLSWMLPFFLITGGFYAKFLRYLLPITPLLLILGARLIFDLEDRLKGKRPPWPSHRLAFALIFAVLASSLFYSLAHIQIYSKPHPGQQMAFWIRENVPKGSSLLRELWEEWLPGLGDYKALTVDFYREPDNDAKINYLIANLRQADYIVFYSHGVYATIARLPKRYPATARYYRLLFSGRLGFDLVYAATSYPNLFGISLIDETFGRASLPTPKPLDSFKPSRFSLNLGTADESLTYYDHPKCMIFKKTRQAEDAEIASLLSGPS